MGGASSQEPRAVTVEEVEEDDGQARINVRDARTGEAYFRNVSKPLPFPSPSFRVPVGYGGLSQVPP